MVYEPPTGDLDIEADAELAELTPGKYRTIEVDGVGTIHARWPLPNAVPALASAANSKISERARLDQLTLFIQNHIEPSEFVDLLARMSDPEVSEALPEDTMLRVSRAIATAGTSRPT